MWRCSINLTLNLSKQFDSLYFLCTLFSIKCSHPALACGEKSGGREKNGRARTKKWWKMRGKRQRKKSSGAALVPELYCFPQKILRERIHLAFRLMNLHQTLPGKALWKKKKKKKNNSTITSLLPSIFFREAHTHTQLMTSFTLSLSLRLLFLHSCLLMQKTQHNPRGVLLKSLAGVFKRHF